MLTEVFLGEKFILKKIRDLGLTKRMQSGARIMPRVAKSQRTAVNLKAGRKVAEEFIKIFETLPSVHPHLDPQNIFQ